MHLDYGSQVRWKREIFEQVLRGIALIKDWPALRVHPSRSEYYYRFRTRLHIRGARVGFYRRASNVIVPWDRCLQLPSTLNTAVHGIRTWLDSSGGVSGLVSCEAAQSPVDQSLTFVWNFSNKGNHRTSVRKFLDGVEQFWSGKQVEIAGQAAHDSAGNTIAARGGNLALRAGSAHLSASPGTFFQVNPEVNDILVQRVLDHIVSHGSTSLLDLYCGNGNFSLPASAAGLKTFGVESNRSAVFDARSSSGPQSRFVEMDAVNFLSRDKEDPDVVIVDPPRTGLPREMTRLLGIRRYPLLLYVSCEPSTLARDLARLTRSGYAIKNLELFDMFPQTFHAEMLVVLKG
jgi:23S rRNA (uracil1939-C5)-methyltransferase